MKSKQKLFLGISTPLLATFLGFMFFASSSQIVDETASLFISPQEGEFYIDKNFTISLRVDAKVSINTAEVLLLFDPEIIEVVNMSKENSIFSLWLQEPIFSNASGSIEFAGGVPNGYKGIGELLTVTFKPKRADRVTLSFMRASVLANDGEGSEIIKEKINGTFVIREAERVFPDFNNDGKLNMQDISILLSYWNKDNPKYDLNRDGQINLVDISILLNKIK